MIKATQSMKIPIQTLYQMLTYAYPDLTDDTLAEDENAFESLDELLSEILLRGINRQLRKGLYKTYVPKEEALTMIRGKIDIPASIRLKTQQSRLLYCKFDEFDSDNFYNQILKSTCLHIIRQGRVCQRKRKRIRDMLIFFNNVSELSLPTVVWEEIRFHKDKISYRSLISLCYMVYKGVYEDEATGKTYLNSMVMSDLYGRFLHHFYLMECKNLKLEYQGKSLGSIKEGATGMKSALTVDMILSDYHVGALINNHYYLELLEESKNPQRETMVYEHMNRLLLGLTRLSKHEARMSDKKKHDLYGVFLYPSLEENYLEEYPLKSFKLYLGAVNLTMPFAKIRKQLIQIAYLGRN